MANLIDKMEFIAQSTYCKKLEELNVSELHLALGQAVMGEYSDNWKKSKAKHNSARRAYYFSAEFLMGRMIFNNLFCLGILGDVTKLLAKKGIDINMLEDVEDPLDTYAHVWTSMLLEIPIVPSFLV